MNLSELQTPFRFRLVRPATGDTFDRIETGERFFDEAVRLGINPTGPAEVVVFRVLNAWNRQANGNWVYILD